MRIVSLLLFASVLSNAQVNVPMTVQGATATQIVVSYTAPSSAACTLTATDNSHGVPAYDLDPTEFTNANQDLSRTVANGFRWPTMTDGLNRTVVLGGHDEIKKALDGKSYSTAYEANAVYTITISCLDGTYTGTITASTQNPPYASYAPELPIPDPTQAMLGVQPSIDWADRTAKYTDPITGVLIQRVTGPADNFDDTNSATMAFTTPVIDRNSAWTNPNNAISNQVAATLASTSTINAPLFLPFDTSFVPPGPEFFTDFKIVPFGNASSNSVIAEWCISEDSGQTCTNFTPIDVTYSTAVGAYSSVPSSYPTHAFAGWGGMSGWFGSYDILNRGITGVTASGSTVSIISPSAPGFNLDRLPGSKFRLSSCAVGADTTLTVATVDTYAQITVQETSLNLQNCTYKDQSAGIRVIMKNAGTLNLSVTGSGAIARSGAAGSNGARFICAQSKVNDIAVDCDGHAQSPPLSGYLCGLSNQGIYLIQDNGRMCQQSSLYGHSAGTHLQLLLSGTIPFTDARTVILPDFQNPQHIWKATHVAKDYTEFPIDPTHSLNDRFTYTDLGTTASNIGAQVIATGGTVATALSSGLWPPLSLDEVGDDGAGNTVIQYRSTANGQDSPCMLAWADGSNNLISSLSMWGTYPFTYGACHFAANVSSGYSFVSPQAESSQLSPIQFNSSALLGGPFVSRSSEGMRKNGSLVTWSITISTCTKASPAVCTSTANNLDNVTAVNSGQGAYITISGATGTGWTALNASWYAHKIDNNTFSLYSDPKGTSPLDSTGFGTLGGTITATMLPPLYSVQIGSVVNNGGNARMVASFPGGYNQYYPSGTLVMRDADPITIVPTYFNSTTQYYAKVTGAPAGDFDVYTDAALTTPASFASLSGAAGSYANYAEACPDPAAVTLPGPMYMDTGFRTTGAGNQKIRCVTIRLNSEGCSDYPITNEQAAYPCASDPSNVNRSSFHQIHVGDAFGDLSHFGGNHEILFVLAVNRVTPTKIDVTLERSYGDDPKYGWRGVTNGTGDTFAQQHSPGWTLWAEASIPTGLIHVTTSPPTFAIPPINGSHSDFVSGATVGNVTSATCYAGGCPDAKVNVPIATYTGPLTATHNSFPFFSGSAAASLTSLAQSYPSKRILASQAPSSELNWSGDWMAMNGAFGNSQNNGDGVGLTRTLVNIRGTPYDPGNTTSTVWKIPVMSPVNVKQTPVLVTNWPHSYYVDMSGPGSLITDANIGRKCTAYAAGECRPTSVAGDTFFSGRAFSDAFGQCIANDATLGSPCAFGLWPGGGWAVQARQVPIDNNANGVRRLTLGWTLPLAHYDFSNWIATPDGKWGLFAGAPVQQRPAKSQYSGTQWFAMLLPPTPPTDTVTRKTFVQIPVRLSGISGDTIRIALGYGENGDPTSFYCTSRAEACYTTTNATAINPFVFASEIQGYTACSAGCTVNIPAIPGRVLYYQIERKNGSTVNTGSLTLIAVL